MAKGIARPIPRRRYLAELKNALAHLVSGEDFDSQPIIELFYVVGALSVLLGLGLSLPVWLSDGPFHESALGIIFVYIGVTAFIAASLVSEQS